MRLNSPLLRSVYKQKKSPQIYHVNEIFSLNEKSKMLLTAAALISASMGPKPAHVGPFCLRMHVFRLQ